MTTAKLGALFSHKVVLITGASSGIGSATAKYFARLGASVVLTGRNKERLDEIAKYCAAFGPTFHIVGDVTNESDRINIIESTVKHFGQLDVLVNNAGILETGSIETTNLNQFDRVMDVNLRSVYHLSMLAVPYLIKVKGNIVNVSSVNGIRAFVNVLAYSVSKAALDQLTRCVALELATKGVRCNSVNPGVTVTELHKRGGMNEQQYKDFLEHSKSTHALGRPGNVDEVAQAIGFLANNDTASFITGVSLPCDGGRHAMCPR